MTKIQEILREMNASAVDLWFKDNYLALKDSSRFQLKIDQKIASGKSYDEAFADSVVDLFAEMILDEERYTTVMRKEIDVTYMVSKRVAEIRKSK